MRPIPNWATHVDDEGNFWANKDYKRPITSADFDWPSIIHPCSWIRNDIDQPYINTFKLIGTTLKGTRALYHKAEPPEEWMSIYTVSEHALLLALEGKTFKRTGLYTLEEITNESL